MGWVRGCVRPLEQLDDTGLRSAGLEPGRDVRLEFTSGVVVSGKLEKIVREDAGVILLGFSTCRAALGDRTLFDPEWGPYDMAVGEGIVSVSQGAADQDAYEDVGFVPRERTIRVDLDDKRQDLDDLYAAVREIRESDAGHETLRSLFDAARARHPGDWLLALEILEILVARGREPRLQEEIRRFLDGQKMDPAREGLIAAGLAMLATA